MVKFESYLDILKNQKQRKIYSKFRLSSHDLEIERGRYGSKSTPVNKRICNLCSDGKVEDEFHFLIECPFYMHERNSLFEYIFLHFANVAQLNDYDKFIWLMSQEDGFCTLKVARYLQKATDKRQYELQRQFVSSSKKKESLP